MARVPRAERALPEGRVRCTSMSPGGVRTLLPSVGRNRLELCFCVPRPSSHALPTGCLLVRQTAILRIVCLLACTARWVRTGPVHGATDTHATRARQTQPLSQVGVSDWPPHSSLDLRQGCQSGRILIQRSEVVPALSDGQTDTVWRDGRTQVVVISCHILLQLNELCKAVEKDVKENFNQEGGWPGTTNTLKHWLEFLGCEALTDVASADSASVIHLLGPFKSGEAWPKGIPNGGKERPYTELARVVVGGQAPRFEKFSRYNGTPTV